MGVQESIAEGKNYDHALDIRYNLEAGRSEGVTGKEANGKPARAQDTDTKVPSGIEEVQEMQVVESGGGGRDLSGE